MKIYFHHGDDPFSPEKLRWRRGCGNNAYARRRKRLCGVLRLKKIYILNISTPSTLLGAYDVVVIKLDVALSVHKL